MELTSQLKDRLVGIWSCEERVWRRVLRVCCYRHSYVSWIRIVSCEYCIYRGAIFQTISNQIIITLYKSESRSLPAHSRRAWVAGRRRWTVASHIEKWEKGCGNLKRCWYDRCSGRFWTLYNDKGIAVKAHPCTLFERCFCTWMQYSYVNTDYALLLHTYVQRSVDDPHRWVVHETCLFEFHAVCCNSPFSHDSTPLWFLWACEHNTPCYTSCSVSLLLVC